MSIPPPVMHVNPHAEQNCHAALSEGMGMYEKMDEFQDKFLEMQKELRAIRGQDLFGKEAADLCLVPNVKIPHKFKVPTVIPQNLPSSFSPGFCFIALHNHTSFISYS